MTAGKPWFEDIRLRQAMPEDLPVYREVHRMLSAHHASHAPELFLGGEAPSDAELISRLHDPGRCILIAEHGRGFAGLVEVTVEETHHPVMRWRRYGWVDVLYVDEASRGCGAGRLLMDAAHAWAGLQEVREMELNVWGFNAPARALYESMGYRVLRQTMHLDLNNRWTRNGDAEDE